MFLFIFNIIDTDLTSQHICYLKYITDIARYISQNNPMIFIPRFGKEIILNYFHL